MDDKMDEKIENLNADEEQFLYAKVLGYGMLLGLAILLLTFLLYATGIMAPAIPKDTLANYWQYSAHHYLEVVEEEYLHLGRLCDGWTWTRLLGKGDYVNFIGIATLSAITILCYLAIIPTLLRKGDKVYAIIALLEALILSLAASGILAVGH